MGFKFGATYYSSGSKQSNHAALTQGTVRSDTFPGVVMSDSFRWLRSFVGPVSSNGIPEINRPFPD
jgi:hypothetical protein